MEFKYHLGKEREEGEGDDEGKDKGKGPCCSEPSLYRTRAFNRIFTILYFLSRGSHFHGPYINSASDTRSVEMNLSFKERCELYVLGSSQI